jgi:AraC family transcriptional regulator
MVGEPVKEHIRRLRLERAAHRLKTSDQPITQLAFEAGYEAHEAFTRSFKTMFGESPTRFREIHRQIPMQEVPSGVHYLPDGQLTGFQPVQTQGAAMDARIETIEPIRVAFMRHVGPYHQVGETWGKFCGWVAQRGLFGPNTKMLGLCHDDPEVTPPEKIRYDACLVVGDDVQPEGDIGVQEIHGGEYAITTHHGPYERLGATYAALCGQWIPAQNREPAPGPSIEMYRNSPQETPPEELLTDVYVPLQPK